MAHLRSAIKAYANNPAVKTYAPVVKTPTPAKGVTRPLVTPGIPPAAGPAAPPAAAPLPWDANYENTVGGINRNRETALSGLTYEEAQAKQRYGFDDASDPFNRLNMLKEAFANSQRGNTNSYASRGQLYAGSLGDAQVNAQHTNDINTSNLRREYDDVLNGIAQRRTQTQNDATDATAGANWDRIQAGLAARTDPSTLPPAATPTPGQPPPAMLASLEKAWRANKNHTVSWEDHARKMGWM
jgi:hypothetical protein